MSRIIDYPEKTSLGSDDYLLLDSSSDGTKKIPAGNIVTIDPTFTKSGQPADAKKTGDKITSLNEEVKEILDNAFTSEYDATFNVVQGGVTTTGANYGAIRARTQYFDVLPNTAYFLIVDTTTYSILNPCLYSAATQDSFSRNVSDSMLDDRSVFFKTGDSELKFRVAFCLTADKERAINSSEYETIRAAIHIYTASSDETIERFTAISEEISSVKEDADFATEKLIDQLYRDDMSFGIGSVRLSTGTTWNILTRIKMNYTPIVPHRSYRFEISNPNYRISYVHFYSDNKETTWLGNPITVNGDSFVFVAPENANFVRIVFYDVADDSREMSENDVTAVKNSFQLYQYEANTAKKERVDEFIRFTVKVNHRWTNNDSTTVDDAESGTETDHLCVITLPSTYSAYGEKTPLIMYCHGASCGITDTSWYGNSTGEGDGANFLTMIRRLTSEGYAVFDVDNTRHKSSGFNDWGSLPLMSAYIKAWEYIRENYNVEDDLYLLSASMGTPAALNMMKWYKGRIKASMLLAPRPTGVKGRWDDTVTAERIKEFLVAWGFEDDSILTDDTFVVPTKAEVFTPSVDARYKGFYHYENMVTIDGTNYIFEKFPPTKVMVGTSDTGFLTETREYFSALQNFGNYINYREVAGKSHGAMCTLVGGNLLDEGVAWFERFRYTE